MIKRLVTLIKDTFNKKSVEPPSDVSEFDDPSLIRAIPYFNPKTGKIIFKLSPEEKDSKPCINETLT